MKSRAIPFNDSQHGVANDYKSGVNITVIGIFANLFLSGIKLAGGVYGQSYALVIDGVHSLADLLTDFAVLFGLKYLVKAKDAEHHYGHGKIETLLTIFLGMFLIVTGVLIAQNTIDKIIYHKSLFPQKIAIVVAAISVILKEVLFRFTNHIGKKIKSSILIGNAWHHRSDALSSLAVLFGVAGSCIHHSWYILDSYAALIVTFPIVLAGGQVAWKGIKDIIDSAPPVDILDRIEAAPMNATGVMRVCQMRARYSGSYIFADISIEVDSEIPVMFGHKIATEVKNRILTEIPEVIDVLVSLEPAKRNYYSGNYKAFGYHLNKSEY